AHTPRRSMEHGTGRAAACSLRSPNRAPASNQHASAHPAEDSIPMSSRPTTLGDLRRSGWKSRTVKEELRANLIALLKEKQELFPGIVGYDDTVIPEIINGILAGHDLLFLGEKGQAKSRLMRMLVRFLDEEIPYLDMPGSTVHEDP